MSEKKTAVKKVASRTNAILVTIEDTNGISPVDNKAPGLDGYEVIVGNQSEVQTLLFAHVAKNWRSEWGKIPGRQAAIDLYFHKPNVAQTRQMPSGVSRTVTASFTTTQLPFMTADRLARLLPAPANKGNGRKTGTKAGVGAR